MFAKGNTTNEDVPVLRDEYENLLQDQLSELRPLRRRPPMMRPRFVTLKVVQNDGSSALGKIVKLST